MSKTKETSRRRFYYYTDWAEQLLTVPADLRLKIDDAVKRYVLYGEEPTDREVLYSMFGLMRSQLDRDRISYAETCNANRNNINERWKRVREAAAQDDTNEYDRIRKIRPYTNDTDKIREDKIREKEKDTKKKIATKRAAFVAPTRDALCAYLREKDLKNVNVDAFMGYYESNGWRVGKNPMKDWRATACRWNARHNEFTNNKNTMQHETRPRYEAFSE